MQSEHETCTFTATLLIFTSSGVGSNLSPNGVPVTIGKSHSEPVVWYPCLLGTLVAKHPRNAGAPPLRRVLVGAARPGVDRALCVFSALWAFRISACSESRQRALVHTLCMFLCEVFAFRVYGSPNAHTLCGHACCLVYISCTISSFERFVTVKWMSFHLT